MKPQTVAIVAQYAPSVPDFRGPLIRDLRKAGCMVHVLAPDWTTDLEESVKTLGAIPHRYPMERTGTNPLRDLIALLFLFHWMRHYRPHIALSYAAKTNVWGMLAAALAGVPHRVAIVEGLGYAFTEDTCGRRSFGRRTLAWLLIFLYRMAFHFVHRVVVLNPDDALILQRWCGIGLDKIADLDGIGIPLNEWPSSSPHMTPVTFTLVARLLKEKGIIEFLEAAKRVKIIYPQTRFWLLGGVDSNPGGITAADLHPWVQEGVVEWPGHVNVKSWLQQTSVFVLPSYREGIPRSTQEAMAMARPVITTDAPGCRETVLDGINGYLVPPREVDALEAAMIRFVEEPHLIKQMGRESRRLAEKRFDVRLINRQLMKILKIR